MIEHRKHPRYALDVDCTLHGASDATLRARTRNLSRSGISCMLPSPLEVGAPFVIEMALAFEGGLRSEPISLGATVVWCTRLNGGFQIGARFEVMEPPMEELLEMFIRFLQGLDED
jgi:hypothetical protein